MKTDEAFADYVKFNDFANEIVHASGLDMLRDQMSADLIKLEQHRIRIKWKIGVGIIAALVGLSILLYFIKFNEKGKTFIPGNYQKNNSTPEQGSHNKISNPVNNQLSTRVFTLARTSADNVNTETKDAKLMDTTSSLTQIQHSADSTYTSVSIVDRKEEITQEKKIGKDCTISFDAVVQLTCRGEQNGSIQVDQKLISGGTAPYSLHLSNTEQQSSTGIFSDLAKGNYIITITDSKACSASKEITVYEKSCTAKKTFSFNPDYGEKWEMQVNPGKSGSFTIYNRGGIIVRSNSFLPSHSIEWDGTNALGAIVEVGVYICVINYTNEKNEIIELAIVR